MKIQDVLYKTPEMTEEKLLALIEGSYGIFVRRSTIKRLEEIYGRGKDVPKMILNEWDLIQAKQSYLSKSQKDQILAAVSIGLARMTNGEQQ